jgi:hypothetical protein
MAKRSTRDTVCVGVHSLRGSGVTYHRHHLPAEVGNDLILIQPCNGGSLGLKKRISRLQASPLQVIYRRAFR